MTDRKPSRWAQSWAEVLRTGAALAAASGTVYLVGGKLGWW